MPIEDLLLVVRWWGTLFLFGAAAYPLTRALFSRWTNHGYAFSKAVGMAVIPWIAYVLGTIRILPFSTTSVLISLGILFVIGLVFNIKSSRLKNKSDWVNIVSQECFFFVALLFWSWIKGHEPSIRGLEKFMDYGFMKSILETHFFPPADMWYAGLPINYYYFGHLVTATLTKLSGIDLAYTFNLMLATLFALTITMSFSIGKQLTGIVTGFLTAFLVTLAGNMQTIYAFTRGYTGEDVVPFWQILWPVAEFWTRLPEGLERYWYANATRFIPFTIHEFPSYSFVVSDVHGHVLSVPFVLLAIGLLIHFKKMQNRVTLVFYGFLVGVLLMTNALDGPIYLGLLAVMLAVAHSEFSMKSVKWWVEKGKTFGLVVVSAFVTSLPFLSHFKSFVSGLALNCPPEALANTNIGPLIFEGVEKCQHSPLWMLWILWGFFVFCGGWWALSKRHKKFTQTELLLAVFFIISILLIIFPEFFYFKDIYPAHFRSNTMFKLGYDAFILFSIVSAYAIVHMFRTRKRLFLILLIPQLFLVSIYPIFSVRSYFNGLRDYRGLYGLTWLMEEYPDDYAGIEWLNRSPSTSLRAITTGLPVIIEADGDSYTDFERFSAFTGMPTIIGWSVHEWLWRGTYDAVSPRKDEVRLVYESDDLKETKEILMRYGVRYIVIGGMERQMYPQVQEWKFEELGSVVFENDTLKIYIVDNESDS